MRLNDDGKTVAAMDILAPGIGEIVGGSQREERLEVLESRMKEIGVQQMISGGTSIPAALVRCRMQVLGWGFERMVQFVTVWVISVM
jgi:asparaginyl-tRNA synthetase